MTEAVTASEAVAAAATTGSDGGTINIISEETSKRICSHMNEDHAASVHGMVLRYGNLYGDGHVSECRMKKISLDGVQLGYVICYDETMCEMKELFIPFTPPLTSVKEARPRLIRIHHEVMKPQLSWFVTDPIAVVVIMMTMALAYGTYGFGGSEGLAAVIDEEHYKGLRKGIVKIFGSTLMFAKTVQFFWYLAIWAHLIEGAYIAHHSITTFKLGLGTTLMWFYMVLHVGYPVGKHFLELLKVHTVSQGDKKAE